MQTILHISKQNPAKYENYKDIVPYFSVYWMGQNRGPRGEFILLQLIARGVIISKMEVNKYDRQIRLWGHLGQKRLSEAKVALLNCSGAGIEALKNLVLPGIGQIDIWDEHVVTDNDLSLSFFYAMEDIGKSRAESAVHNLLEMNPDVKGEAFVKSPSELLYNIEKLRSYSLIISDLKDEETKLLSKICQNQKIGVVFITVIGFYVYIRNQKALHCVESENTLSKKYYMRLHDPFPALQKHSDRWNIEGLITEVENVKEQAERKVLLKEIGYIPYPLILLQAYQSLPKENRKKQPIIKFIKDWLLRLPQGHRQNFNEAAGRTLDLFQTPDNFLDDISIFDHPQVASAAASSQKCLIFLRSCQQFFKRSKHLPQPTKLPDMHTSTQYYLQLKATYRTQHVADLEQLTLIIRELFGDQVTLDKNLLSDYVDNLNCLKVLEFTPYHKEITEIDNPNLRWEDPAWRNILVALRAYKHFENKQNRAPTPQDTEKVAKYAESIKLQYGLEDLDNRYVQEVSRVEGQTAISLNSIAGAIAGQESIKLITHCFTPMKNGYLFDGIHSTGYSISL